ncbi:hypothetical protein NA56DRAFT_662518 [Hyaloscypha hepaticicola]|uniref:Uncharacterized protein n=1 Tax=Hyaloscypha hepaticicola TaxID=2082293 RepID=A0A2J6PT62_9HELO|nr:hypothetical protein NA56DRAFT_662518 [Hyaloscypha hepaticicola]
MEYWRSKESEWPQLVAIVFDFLAIPAISSEYKQPLISQRHNWLRSFYGKNGLVTSSRSSPEHPEDDDLMELSKLFSQNKKIEETEAWNNNHTDYSLDLEHDAWSKNEPILYTHVCEESAKFLYKPKDFMAGFNTMTIKRKQYFRLLVLLQLQDVDRRLKCANKKDAKSGWSVLNVDDGPRNNLIVRRFATLKSLGSFLDTLDPLQLKRNYDDADHRKKFRCIFKSQLDSFDGFTFQFMWESKVLLHMKVILDSSYNTISESDWVRPSTQNALETKVPGQPGRSREHIGEEANSTGGREKSDGWKQLDKRLKKEERWGYYVERDWRQELKKGEEWKKNIRRVTNHDYAPPVPEEWGLEDIANHIIFRSILLCLLFCTAPDTSDMLLSGLWEHVIPVI